MQSILDHQILSSRYFFPRRDGFDEPFWVENGDVQLACYYKEKHPDAMTVIFFHGNGEVVADYINLYVPLMDQLGCNCCLAEYRGYGMSSGDPTLVAMLSDVKAVVDALQKPREKIVLFGRSVGSIYAVHGVSVYPDIAGLVIESGIADVYERIMMRLAPGELGKSNEELFHQVQTHLDAEGKLNGFKGRSLVMHARHDSLVDLGHGQALYGFLPEPRRLKIFEKGDHNDIFSVNAGEYIEELRDFLGAF